MELAAVTPQLNLYDKVWPIFTHQLQLPPAKFVFDDVDRRGEAIQSMVAGGCVISGSTVRRSLLFTNCYVNPYSTITDSVVLPDVVIGERCTISNAIIDRGSVVPAGTEIGVSHDADRERGFRVTKGGRTLVTAEMLGQQLHFTR